MVGITDSKYYEEIAKAIQEKLDEGVRLTPSEMANAIKSIPTSQTPTLKPYDVDVIPDKSNQIITAPLGYYINRVNIQPIPTIYRDTSDANITADKVLKGYVGYGASGRVIGTYEGTSDEHSIQLDKTIQGSNVIFSWNAIEGAGVYTLYQNNDVIYNGNLTSYSVPISSVPVSTDNIESSVYYVETTFESKTIKSNTVNYGVAKQIGAFSYAEGVLSVSIQDSLNSAIYYTIKRDNIVIESSNTAVSKTWSDLVGGSYIVTYYTKALGTSYLANSDTAELQFSVSMETIMIPKPTVSITNGQLSPRQGTFIGAYATVSWEFVAGAKTYNVYVGDVLVGTTGAATYDVSKEHFAVGIPAGMIPANNAIRVETVVNNKLYKSYNAYTGICSNDVIFDAATLQLTNLGDYDTLGTGITLWTAFDNPETVVDSGTFTSGSIMLPSTANYVTWYSMMQQRVVAIDGDSYEVFASKVGKGVIN